MNFESTIRNEIDACIPMSWDEDTITYNIIQKLWTTYQTTLISNTNSLHVEWQPYKLTKKRSMEQRFGDVAIIVHILFADGTSLRGVGFLEAKKRDIHSRKFDSIKKNQFQRILTNAPHAQVLLYDHLETKHFSDLGLPKTRIANPLIPSIPTTKSLSSPMNFVYENDLNDEEIYNVSLPFSYQLCFRYLQGFDLEYDATTHLAAVQGVEELSKDMSDAGFPEYLMAFSVSLGESSIRNVIPHSISTEYYEKFQ